MNLKRYSLVDTYKDDIVIDVDTYLKKRLKYTPKIIGKNLEEVKNQLNIRLEKYVSSKYYVFLKTIDITYNKSGVDGDDLCTSVTIKFTSITNSREWLTLKVVETVVE